MTVLEAFEQSIRAAIASGSLDAEKNAAPIEAGRKVAALMDDPEFPYINGKYDNVSAALFLKYCTALGLVEVAEVAKAEKPKDKLAEIKLLTRKAAN